MVKPLTGKTVYLNLASRHLLWTTTWFIRAGVSLPIILLDTRRPQVDRLCDMAQSTHNIVGGTHFPVKPTPRSGPHTMATPTRGPSSFCAPAGRCRCTLIMASDIRSWSPASSLVMPRSYAYVLTQMSASSALSLIISPRKPINLRSKLPLPGEVS